MLRVGFLGAGLIATYHSKLLRRAATPFVRAGVFDPDPARTTAFAAASGHTPCRCEDEVLDGCDAVFVCTWTSEHPRLVTAAAERGLAVFCEKPLATDLAAAEDLARVLDRTRVTNQVGLVLRRSPAFLVLRDLAREPAAGRLQAIVFRDDQYLPNQGRYASTWRADRSKAGAGTLLEHSIHDLDLLRFLAGDVASVSAHQANFHGIPGIEDVVTASFAFADGGLATLASVWHDNLARPSLRRVELLCERRHVVLDGDDWKGPVTWIDTDGAGGSLAGDDLADRAARLLDGPANPSDAFVLAATRGEPAWPDAATALLAHRLADACYRSAAAGGAAVAVPRVVDLPAEATHDLRRRVLRTGTPSTEVTFAEDQAPDARHLGVRLGDDLVAVATTFAAPCPGRPGSAHRLRAMAVDPAHQGTGLGRLLLDEVIRRLRRRGVEVLWAEARDSALGFYERAGLQVDGDGFVTSATGLPHHRVVLEL